MMTRVCKVCGEEKPISEFHRNGLDKFGNVAYRNDCKVCYRIVRKVSKKKLTKFLNNTKQRTGEIAQLTVHDWKDAMVYFKGCCAYCGRLQSRRNKLTKDHVVPVSKGGLTVRHNIIPGCVSCNSSKSDNDLDEWYPKQSFYSDERMKRIRAWMVM